MSLDFWTRLDPLRRLRCPSCLAEFAAYEMHVRCASDVCRNDFARQVEDPILTRTLTGQEPQPGSGTALRSPWWVDPRRDESRPLRRHLDLLVLPGALDCPACGHGAEQRLCPRCHRDLPDRALLPRHAGNITIFGPQAVGKTTFMTVLLQEIRKGNDPRRLGLRPLDDEIRQRYRHDYQDVTYGPRDATVLRGEAVARSRHAPTLSLEIDRRVLQPLIYELKTPDRPGPGPLVSFCDLAGEDWEMKTDLLRREGGHLVRRSRRGLLFLIDPLRIPAVAEQMDLTEEEALVPPADYVEDADKLADFFRRAPVRTPLAIVLNKIDRWGGLLGPDTALHQTARGVPTDQPDARLDRVVHEEVRAALRRWGQSEFLDRLEADFPAHRFFACSALGDAAQARTDLPPPAPTPLLVDRPALWLLERQGLVKPRGRG